jgi:tRNA uridine 5-carboxymethylaminomethyl modification enzyme
MKAAVEAQPGLHLRQAMVDALLVENHRVCGLRDHTGFEYPSKTVVLATGTFLSGLIHIGFHAFQAGRAGEFASYALPDHLKTLGFSTGRMKTGTPPRLKRDSIDFSCFTRHDPDPSPAPFSVFSGAARLPQLPSFIGRTNPASHRVVRQNLERSALYGGRIHAVSARYCPSLEDKVVRFSDKNHHQIILEPEGLDTDEIYASGLGNSLPMAVQVRLVRSVKGLEEAEIVRPAYAIEYDYVNPSQLRSTLETKKVAGLFLAGQINGTSGYEEAAAQGLWAGINAALKVQNRPPFVLDRSQAYMGVLVDDLITRGTLEPYRMFTSRAEHRLMLREDNADLRLMEIGADLGLIPPGAAKAVREKKEQIEKEIQRIKATILKPSAAVNTYLKHRKSPPLTDGIRLDQLLKRSELNYEVVARLAESSVKIPESVSKQVEIEVKYEGYIQRQLREIEKFKTLETQPIPEDFDFTRVHGLSNELKQKLSAVMPVSLGQASRVDGMTPSALSVLIIALRAATRRDAASQGLSSGVHAS